MLGRCKWYSEWGFDVGIVTVFVVVNFFIRTAMAVSGRAIERRGFRN